MSIILSKEILGRHLDTVEKALSRKSPLQYLDNILCEIDSQKITLSTTNLEQSIKVSLPYQGEASGKVLLPSKIIEIVRYLPESEVVFNLNPDNLQIDLSSGKAKYHLSGANPADFPPVEKVLPENAEKITITTSDLREILKMVVFAASTEETRPAFNGVLFDFNVNHWGLVSSDTYRLVVNNIINESWNFTPQRCLVPAKALRELLKILEQGDEQIVMFPMNDQLIFNFGTVYFAARLLNEKYPDISSVIPERYSTRLIINRSDMAETVARAALLAEGPNNAIHLSVVNSSLAVRVSSQIGRMEEVLSAEYEGEEVDLYVNSRFIMDILRVLSTKKMVIDFHGKTGPVIFRLPENYSYLYLVLPIKMN